MLCAGIGTGRLKKKAAPLVRDSAHMRPPCSSTSRLLMARPRPVPGLAVVGRVLQLAERLEQARNLVFADAGTRVLHLHHHVVFVEIARNGDAATVYDLAGIAEQIHNHLPDAGGVAQYLGQVLALPQG